MFRVRLRHLVILRLSLLVVFLVRLLWSWPFNWLGKVQSLCRDPFVQTLVEFDIVDIECWPAFPGLHGQNLGLTLLAVLLHHGFGANPQRRKCGHASLGFGVVASSASLCVGRHDGCSILASLCVRVRDEVTSVSMKRPCGGPGRVAILNCARGLDAADIPRASSLQNLLDLVEVRAIDMVLDSYDHVDVSMTWLAQLWRRCRATGRNCRRR